MKEIQSYIRKHWRGELPLEISYWINAILFSVVLRLISSGFIENVDATENTTLWMLVLILYFTLIYFIVYPWIYVGLWRSADRHIEKYDVRFWANVVKILVIIGVVRSFLSFYNIGFPQIREFIYIAMGKDRISSYQITIDEKREELEIIGGVNYGLSRDVKSYLDKYPQLKTIRINSIGGRTEEARKLSKLIKEKKLNTHAFNICYSACTYIFISGENRVIEQGTILGFHQPSFVGIETKQIKKMFERDKKLFDLNGIERSFTKKVFETNSSDLWMPSYQELKDAGVVTKIVTTDDRFKDMSLEELKRHLSGYSEFSSIINLKIEEIIDRMVKERKKHLPDMIDTLTRQENIYRKNLEINYKFTILDDSLTTTDKENMKIGISKTMCNNPFALFLQKNNVSFKYNYFDRNGSELGTIFLNNCSKE